MHLTKDKFIFQKTFWLAYLDCLNMESGVQNPMMHNPFFSIEVCQSSSTFWNYFMKDRALGSVVVTKLIQ